MNENKELDASAADATDRATDAPHGADKSSPPSGSVSTGAGAFAAGRWISVKDERPPEHGPPILITNNMSARSSFGHMTHVWIGNMLHDDPEAPGEVCAVVGDNLRKVWGVTHWAAIAPLATEQAVRQAVRR